MELPSPHNNNADISRSCRFMSQRVSLWNGYRRVKPPNVKTCLFLLVPFFRKEFPRKPSRRSRLKFQLPRGWFSMQDNSAQGLVWFRHSVLTSESTAIHLQRSSWSQRAFPFTDSNSFSLEVYQSVWGCWGRADNLKGLTHHLPGHLWSALLCNLCTCLYVQDRTY